MIIQALDTMGKMHADIIPKYTTRAKKIDDGREMICSCKFEQVQNSTIITLLMVRKRLEILYTNEMQIGMVLPPKAFGMDSKQECFKL